jgi:hypothetical protein
MAEDVANEIEDRLIVGREPNRHAEHGELHPVLQGFL